MTAVEIILSIFILLGGFLSLLGSIGIIRFPDVYGRLHAATKSATLGVISIMFATFLYFFLTHDMFIGKLLLTILFVFLTAPVAGMMMGRSAYRVGVPLAGISKQDDLKKMYDKKMKGSRS
ncbi:monovalent cation/H(+) antiporter subunit G [Bacillus sp. FJAT-45037]|uniref:monovalent cation/H(+) antiporter subunit G n=1 Tax=Bacillus sp. FJAT-45037 TaxID=2011007 RepID=UPI000C23020D|nr:monovalent cation/H(+) antiporter subunit G [Bacillus sp. FJAT-45037]